MLPLESPDWVEFDHASGSAADLPQLLEAVAIPGPVNRDWDGPWHQLWERLCNQDCVYTASYAALPHLVSLAVSPEAATDCLALTAAIAAHQTDARSPALPNRLASPYDDALKRIPSVLAQLSSYSWDSDLTRCACAALAASKGQPTLALALLAGHFSQANLP
jgi:hypothetical protein